MRVESLKGDIGNTRQRLNHIADILHTADGDTKLAVQVCGYNIFMGMCLNARIYTNQCTNGCTNPLCRFYQQLAFHRVIDNNAADPCFQCHNQLIPCFVVAVKVDFFHRKAGLHGSIQLTAADDIQTQAVSCRHLNDRLAGERLGRIQNLGFKILALKQLVKLAHFLCDFVLIIHI